MKINKNLFPIFKELNILKEKKDIYKNLFFIKYILEKFDINKYSQIYDLCCGKGTLGAFFSDKKVIAIDNGNSTKRKKLIEHLKENYKFKKQDIWEINKLKTTSLVIGVHTCGSLADKIIELAIESKNDFAVMTCCHSDRIYFTPKEMPNVKLINNMGRDYYQDMIRLNYILEQDYEAGISFIPENITPKNRILWGKQKKQLIN